MPGVCLDVRREEAVPRHSLDSLHHLDTYTHETVQFDSDVFLGYTRHPGYPVTVVETDESVLSLEGYLYDVDRPRERLRSLAPEVFDPASEEVARFVRETDGEFVVSAVDRRSGAVAVLNDAFGRLPVYYGGRRDGVVASREPRFVVDNRTDEGFDQMGLAQYLLFGYTLGTRTLWNGVERLAGGTHLVADAEGETSRARHYEFDFGSTEHADRSVEENARALASLFADACDRRAPDGPQTVLSLSGGLDSRAVVGGFFARDVPFAAATFARGDGSTGGDAEIAERVARAADLDWTKYALDPLGTDEVERLLGLKEGLNQVKMGFILDFFERLVDDYGHRSTYVTGDGGDKALPDLTPSVDIGSLDEFVSYACAKNGVFSPSQVAALTGVDERALRDEVASVVSTYPEDDWADRYVHFLVTGRGRNWLFEGEDRNRGYFWSTSPFYGREFFEYAMNVPADQKSGYRLYREFLDELWPPAAGFEHADFGVALDSPMYGVIQRGLDLIDGHPRLERLVKTAHSGDVTRDVDTEHERRLRRHATNGSAVGRYFSRDAVERVARDRSSYGSKQLFSLLTLTTEIERLAETEQSIEAR
jgi:asparagine synthase (glutamine-hydrolysing)